jgi:hypothetical protein
MRIHVNKLAFERLKTTTNKVFGLCGLKNYSTKIDNTFCPNTLCIFGTRYTFREARQFFWGQTFSRKSKNSFKYLRMGGGKSFLGVFCFGTLKLFTIVNEYFCCTEIC